MYCPRKNNLNNHIKNSATGGIVEWLPFNFCVINVDFHEIQVSETLLSIENEECKCAKSFVLPAGGRCEIRCWSTSIHVLTESWNFDMDSFRYIPVYIFQMNIPLISIIEYFASMSSF